MKSSLNRNLLLGFSVSILILLLSSIASLISINNLLDSAEKVNHSKALSAEINDILTTMIDAETGQRGFLLTNDELFLEPYNGAFNKINTSIANVKQLCKDNTVQLANITTLDEMVKGRFFLLAELISQKRASASFL